MARLRYNNRYGSLASLEGDVTESSTSTTINFAKAPDFATLVSPDYIPLVLDPGTDNFEIVYLTDYNTSQPLTGTVTRAAEDSSNWPAVAHPNGTWASDSTVLDFQNVTSFNGRFGSVTLSKGDVTGTGLTSTDVGADPAGQAAAVSSALTTVISAETSRAETAEANLLANIGSNLSAGLFFNRSAGSASPPNSEAFMLTDSLSSSGAVARQLTNNPAYQTWWVKPSPDGTKILFLRAPVSLGGSYDAFPSAYTQQSLWVANIDGTNPIQIVAQGWCGAGYTNTSYLGVPNWSPDGRDIIFMGGPNAVLLYIVSSDGTSIAPVNIPVYIGGSQVTNGISDPSWSPDGRTICFVYNYNIYTVAFPGGSGNPAVQITNDGTSSYPLHTDPNFSYDNQTIYMLTQFSATGTLGTWGISKVNINAAPTSATTVLNDGNVNSKPLEGEDGYLYFHRQVYGTDTSWTLAKLRSDALNNQTPVRLTPVGSPHDYQPAPLVSKRARVPTLHASTHAHGGVDPFNHEAQHQIGGGDAFIHAAQHAPAGGDTVSLVLANGVGSTAVNTIAATPLWTATITGAGTGNIFRFRASGTYINNSGSSANLQIALSLPSSIPVLTINAVSMPSSAAYAQWDVEGFLYCTGVSAEVISARLIVMPAGASVGVWNVSPTIQAMATHSLTVALSTNPTLAMLVSLGTANANIAAQCLAYFVEQVA